MSTITIRGTVAADPYFTLDSEGVGHLLLHVFERDEDGTPGTRYYVDAPGILAENSVESVLQGDSLLITGELKISQIPASGHIVVAILAAAMGHDLAEVRAKRVV